MNSILEITSYSPTQDLTILATVKTDIGIDSNDENDRLSMWIRQASSMIAAHCDRVFGMETLLETFRPTTPFEQLVLTRYPVASITSVVEDGTTLLTTDYEADLAKGLMRRLSSDTPYCWPARKIVVAYRAGYELLDGLPHGLERACLSLVKLMRAQSSRDSMAKRIEIPGVETIDYWVGKIGENGALPPDVVDLVAPYVNWRP